MTLLKLAQTVSILGKKKCSVSDIKEILSIVGDLWYEECIRKQFPITESADECIDVVLFLAGKKRAKKVKRK